MSIIDRYLLRMALWPMLGATLVTLVALLLERVLRLLDLLAASNDRFGFVAQLAVNLVPHYVGLTLPAAFFIALVIVVNRMNTASEMDALLAAGVSLTRVAAPYLCLAAVLTSVSLIVFGHLQPYSRYGYRAVLHAAQNAGWSGELPEGVIISPNDNLTLTADRADAAGQRLSGVFIRRIAPNGREEITTAGRAQLRKSADGRNVTLLLQNGQQLRFNRRGEPEVLSFRDFTLEVPMSLPERLLRQRGGDERELTMSELAIQAADDSSVIPRHRLLAELYGRLARAFALLLLPLLALPLGLAAKRSGRAPGIIVGAVLLMAFHHFVQLGQSLAVTVRTSPELGIGLPFLGFAAICVLVFVTSRKRPGETPVGRAIDHVSSWVVRMRDRWIGTAETPA